MSSECRPATRGAPPPHAAPAIEFVGVNKWYGAFHVLRDIRLAVHPGERVVVCGPSGSGKSTLIRCVNRLEEHQQGAIRVHGVELTHSLKQIDRVRREVGMVFQQFNLFPHLTVLQNCALAPVWAAERQAPREAEERAHALLAKVKHRRPGAQVPVPAFRRPAAARRHRPGAVHEPEDHAVRRADLGARSRDGQGSARHDDRARRARA